MGSTILVLARNAIHLRRIRISGDDSDRLIILPQGDGEVLRLARPTLTSLLEPLLHEWFQLQTVQPKVFVKWDLWQEMTTPLLI